MRKRKVKIEVKYKVWLEKDGEIIMGQGRELLLKYIDETGSILHASKMLNISYRKALHYIRAMEERLGKKLVESQRGGYTRGGSTLTEDAKKLLKHYENIVKEFEKLKSKLEK
ncbi:MAG: LysR family transcriptional regulator [Hydrogenothermaceae bacterium]